MEPSSVPLLDEQRRIDSTPGSPRNFSKPFGSPASSPSLPDSPYVTLHDFHQIQHEALPFLERPPSSGIRPLRRKSSRRNLSDDFLPAKTHQASNRQLPRVRSLHSQELARPHLIPLPSTPQQLPSAASPSLSSTITTLQSTPTQTPVSILGSELPSSSEAAGRALLEPLRVKRKFANLKPPKRLPRRADDGGWLVLANVIGDSESVERVQVQSVQVPERPRGGLAASERRPQTDGAIAKRDRSVRFAGIWSEGDESESLFRVGKEEEHDATADSTYTLSKFKFPTPPGYAWSGTFGHLSEPTPPTSPATLHYRGASFDLVNPHASLLLGAKDFETPAEIDGLLDDYFDTSQDNLSMQYDQITGESVERSGSTPSSEDGSRRGRTLYTDVSSARSNIMRLPSRPNATGQFHADVADRDLLLAHRSPPVSRPALVVAGTRTVEENLSALSIAGPNLPSVPISQEPFQTAEQSRSRSRGGSTLGAPSTYSDPFDLHVSDDESEQALRQEFFGHIDRMVESGHARTAQVPVNVGGLAGRDVGADAEAHVFHTGRDTTLTNIVDHYDYRSAQDEQDESTSSISIEQGRATAGAERRSTLRSNNPFLSAAERWTAEASQRLRSPPGSPPVAPAPTPAPQSARRGVQPDNTELPTSDQTYGATGELLGLTPAHNQSSVATVGLGIHQAAVPQYIERWDDDKENIPPLDQDEGFGGTHQLRDAEHGMAAFEAPVRIRQPDAADRMRANNMRAFPSLRSWPRAEIYEDETAGASLAQGRAAERHAGDLTAQDHGLGIAAPSTGNQRLDSGFDLAAPTGSQELASNIGIGIRNRDGLNALHNQALEQYESDHSIEDESAWEDETENAPYSHANLHSHHLHNPGNRFSQITHATQGSYADPSDYGDSRRGSFLPPDARDLNRSPLPPGRPHNTGWLKHRLGINMPFTTREPSPDPADQFEMTNLAADIIRQKQNTQRSIIAGETVDRESMRQKEATLERIRQLNTTAVRLAAAQVAAETEDAESLQTPGPRMPTLFRPPQDDVDSFHQVMEAAQQPDTDDVPGSATSRHALLTNGVAPQRPGGRLGYSDTHGTFKTIYSEDSPPMPGLPPSNQEPYSPLPGPPAPVFARTRAGTEDTIQTGIDTHDEHTPLTRSHTKGKGKQRAYVRGQMVPKPFIIGSGSPANIAAPSAPTPFNPGRRLTDSELARRAGAWNLRPSVEPLRAYQALGTAPPASMEAGRRLLGPHEAYQSDVVKQQKAISGRLFNWCCLSPVSALAFGLGAFDGLIANKTDGRVDGACEEDKHAALVVALPVSFVAWAVVIVFVVLAVVFIKTARAF